MALALARRWKLFALVAVGTMLADQLTKYWARAALPSDDRGFGIAVPVIQNFFDWRLSYNTGSAFGLFGGVTGARILLTVIGIVAVGAILFMVRQARDDQRRLVWALGLVAGGAVGNIIDRILFGKVTDFVVWKYHEKEWPTFNVADIALVIGVGLLFLDMGKEKKVQDIKQQKDAAVRARGGEQDARPDEKDPAVPPPARSGKPRKSARKRKR